MQMCQQEAQLLQRNSASAMHYWPGGSGLLSVLGLPIVEIAIGTGAFAGGKQRQFCVVF